MRRYPFEEANLAYFKIIFQHSREDGEKYKEILVTEDSNTVDTQTLNLTNAYPVLSVHEVIQRAEILKRKEVKMSGDLTEDIPANILPSRKSLFAYKKRKKRRKIRERK